MAKKKTLGTAPVPLSKVVIANGFVFISGTVPRTPEGTTPEGIDAQTRLVLDQIKELVEEAGSSMENIVKTTVFLTDKTVFGGMNDAYGSYFPSEPPARSTIICDLAVDVLVEIEAVAVL